MVLIEYAYRPADSYDLLTTLCRKSWSNEDSKYLNCQPHFVERWVTAFKTYLNVRERGQQEQINQLKRIGLQKAEARFPSTLPLYMMRRIDNNALFD